MKNITLTAIIIFLSSVAFVFIAQNFVIHNNSAVFSVKNTKILRTNNVIIQNKNNDTLPKNQQKTTQKQTTKETVQHIKSPNINIIELKKRLSYTQESQVYSFSEIAKHNNLNDCYLVINGNVYDITPYIPYHPAGSRIIKQYCGQEVTGIFANIHSNRAWDLLHKYKIGKASTEKQDVTPQILTAISKALQLANPKATILKVSPKGNAYIAKLIFNNKFYEIHIDNAGNIVREEIDTQELNWDSWDIDIDDR